MLGQRKKSIILFAALLILIVGFGAYKIFVQESKGKLPYKKVKAGSIVLGTIWQGEKSLIATTASAGGVGVGLGVEKGAQQIFLMPVLVDIDEVIEIEKNDNRIYYYEVYPEVDVEHLLYDGHIKENIIIKNEKARKEFEFDLKKSFGDRDIFLENKGSFIFLVDRQTGEEILSLDYPIAFDSKGLSIPYEYRLLADGKLLLTARDKRDWDQKIKYPVVLDPPMTVREYDEVLVKIGQNSEMRGSAKDGDVVEIQPTGWRWGEFESRDYLIVRVPKLTEEQRKMYTKKYKIEFENQEQEDLFKHGELTSQEWQDKASLQDSFEWGIDYVGLISDERILAFETDGLNENNINKEGLLDILWDRSKKNPVLDASGLSLDEIFKQKDFAVALKKAEQDETDLNELVLSDESVVPYGLRLTTRLQEKKSWLAKAIDSIIYPASAQTTNIYTVGTGSCDGTCDYSTLSAWETARDGNITAAGTNAIEIAECYNDGVMTNNLVINGWTTDATHYIKVYTPTSERHTGVRDTGFTLATSGGVNISIAEDDVIIEGLQLNVYSESSAFGIGDANGSTASAEWYISDNILAGTGDWSERGIYLYYIADNATVRIWNNIIHGMRNYGIHFYPWSNDSIYVYNNTIWDTKDVGIYRQDGKVWVKNNVVMSDQTGSVDFSGTYQAGSDYNCSSDNTAIGTWSASNCRSKTSTDNFTDITTDEEDLRVKDVNADVYGNGVDLSEDAGLSFNDDIQGESRPQGISWDIGADEYTVAEEPAVIDDQSLKIENGQIKIKSGQMKINYLWP